MPLSKTFKGHPSKCFVLKGTLCFSLIMEYGFDTRESNEFLQMLDGHDVEVSIREVVANVQ